MKAFGTWVVIVLMGIPAFAVPPTFVYHGRIVSSTGEPLEYNNVSFEFSILSPDGTCLLYKEQVNGLDMTGSKGLFDTAIGNGTKSFPAAPSFSILDAFENENGALSCSDGGTYTPGSNDGRALRVAFHDGSGWKQITPDAVIRSVPFAGYAQSAKSAKTATTATTALTLGTKSESDFLLKPLSCSSGEFIKYNGTSYACDTVSGGSGTVTSVATGAGLTGGTITGSGTISLAPIADKNLLANTSGGSATPVATSLSALIDAAIGSSTGSILYRNASAWTVLPAGTNGDILKQGASTPAWSALSASDWTGTVNVAKGGTGSTTLTNNALLIGQGTSAVNFISPGSAGDVLYVNGSTLWASGSPNTAGLVATSGTQTITGNKTLSGSTTLSGAVTMSSTLTISSGSPGAGKVLTSDASGGATWQTASGGSGSGPGGAVKSANFTVGTSENDHIYFIADGSTVTVTLPAASAVSAGFRVTFKKINSATLNLPATADCTTPQVGTGGYAIYASTGTAWVTLYVQGGCSL